MGNWLSWAWYGAAKYNIMAGLTFGFSIRFEGGRNVPPRGPVLLVANHESFFDPIAVGLASPRHLCFLARKTLFRTRLFGSYLRSVNCVPVDQEGVAKEGLKTSIELLQAGRGLLVFPEGERCWKGEMQPFKRGIQLLLRKAPVPIVPVGVAGAFEAYPRGAKYPKFSPLFWASTGAAVAASVGKAIPPEKYAKMDGDALLRFLFDEVQAQVGNAEKIVRR